MEPPVRWIEILRAELPYWILDTSRDNTAHTWEHKKTIEIPGRECHRHGLFLHELAHAVCFERGHRTFADAPGQHHDGIFADIFDELVTKWTKMSVGGKAA